MEKGEVGILSIQFVALLLAVLVLSNFTHASDVLSTPTMGNVYWGPVSDNTLLTKGGANTEIKDASTITVEFSLASSTTPSSVSADRLCFSPTTTGVGQQVVYTPIVLNYTAGSDVGNFTFGPVGQTAGETCTYSVQMTDSLQQVANTVLIVTLKA